MKTLIYARLNQVIVTLFFNEEFYDHIQMQFHPESPERLKGIMSMLDRHDLLKEVITSKVDGSEHLRLVHDEAYIKLIQDSGECNLTMETIVHPETYGIASLSALCGVDAVNHAREISRPTFALTRPPGHHAGPDYGMGFCYFNNIAIAAEHLLRKGDRRIAIVDCDVHHGNGTEHIFKDRADVLYVSTHQTGIFPGTGNADFVGSGEGEGYTVNMPFPSGCGDSTFHVAYEDVLFPIVRGFRPDAILVSLGADAHYREPLASLSLSSDGYLSTADGLLKLAEACNRRITFFLEGGYDVPALSEVVAGILGAMNDVEIPLEFTDIIDNSCLGKSVIERAARNASEYWAL